MTSDKVGWFKVDRDRSTYAEPTRPWNLAWKTMRNLYSSGRREVSVRSYPTKEEAIAAGLEMGYVQVKDWKEAIVLARPHLNAQNEARDRANDARKGHELLRIPIEGGRFALRYVTLERAQAILDDLGLGDEYGVVRDS